MRGYSLSADISIPGSVALIVETSASVRAALIGAFVSDYGSVNFSDRVQVRRVTGGTYSSVTSEKLDADSPSPTVIGGNNITAEPTIVGQPLLAHGYRITTTLPVWGRMWWAHPRWPIIVDVSSKVDLRTNGANEGRFMLFHEPERPLPTRRYGRRGVRRGYLHMSGRATGRAGGLAMHIPRAYPEFTIINEQTWPGPFLPLNLAVRVEEEAAAVQPVIEYRTPVMV
jgi:hypothetical protein